MKGALHSNRDTHRKKYALFNVKVVRDKTKSWDISSELSRIPEYKFSEVGPGARRVTVSFLLVTPLATVSVKPSDCFNLNMHAHM